MAEPDSFDLNNQPRAADAMTAIPTSTSEVSVRTMASDLELMGKSGGMAGQGAAKAAPAPQAPQTAPAPQTPQGMQVPVTLHPESETDAPQARSGMGKVIFLTAAIVIGAGALFAVGYFVLGN